MDTKELLEQIDCAIEALEIAAKYVEGSPRLNGLRQARAAVAQLVDDNAALRSNLINARRLIVGRAGRGNTEAQSTLADIDALLKEKTS